MTEKELEEIKQKYGFTLRPSAFNGKPIKYVSKEEYEDMIRNFLQGGLAIRCLPSKEEDDF